MAPLSEYIQRVAPSPTMAITAKAAALRREGIDVIALSAGEPDFDTPQHIKDAAIRALEAGFTKYTSPPSGIPDLKEAVAERFRIDHGLDYTSDEIVVNNGAKHALSLAVAAVLNPGDEMIIPTPYWVTFTEQPKLVGANPVVVETQPEDGLKLTPQLLRDAITPRTRMVLINSPSNPSGAVYSRDEMAALGEVIIEHDLYVLGDEIYEKLIYDDAEHVSMATLSDELKARTIIVNGVSKTYAMTGWRIGYAAGPRDVIALMDKAQSQTISHPSSISQKAAVEALAGPQESVEEMRREYDNRRRFVIDQLNAMDGVVCDLPKGAFYAYPDVSAFFGRKGSNGPIEDGSDLCEYLLDEARVACVPGVAFGTKPHLRLSYATSMENLQMALERMADAFGRLS
ncbi:MAG: pyridoxal phosphate-dependent aminotransferase [Gemmatimonadetes bacterium]|jgi:aspartate aminotransferase|nr:pyridoxal phosphate-dependent aminotransferase [Gemmatimonadota bacterium]